MKNVSKNPAGLEPEIAEFFDDDTNTFSYVVSDPSTDTCAVIDSVWNFDYASASLTTESADAIIEYVESMNLDVEWILETHVHADHVSAAAYLKDNLGGKIGIGEDIVTVQETFARIYNETPDFRCDGSQFDHLFKDGETYKIGNLDGLAMHTPGHTPACMTHLIENCAFVGDTLFMPEAGTARADFPGGSAVELYRSIHRIFELPEDTRLYMCHDYSAERPDLRYETTVAEEKMRNVHINSNVPQSAFISMREARDATLGMPRYILPSLQINMRAGHLPDAEGDGVSYLKIPINRFNRR